MMEQASLYNAVNQSVTILGAENQTVHTVSVGAYACPDDPAAGFARDVPANEFAPFGLPDPPGGRQRMVFTSYVGCTGPFESLGFPMPSNGCRASAEGVAQNAGAFCDVSPLSAASIADGLSQTIFMAEKATVTLEDLDGINPALFQRYGWYVAGNWGDTLFTTFYQPNAYKFTSLVGSTAYINSASSLHPGGLNVLMGDGSVRFIKESIDSWPSNLTTGRPVCGTLEQRRMVGRCSRVRRLAGALDARERRDGRQFGVLSAQRHDHCRLASFETPRGAVTMRDDPSLTRQLLENGDRCPCCPRI